MFYCFQLAKKTAQQQSSVSNANFIKFQRSFFLVYFLALLGDWLQGPYVYRVSYSNFHAPRMQQYGGANLEFLITFLAKIRHVPRIEKIFLSLQDLPMRKQIKEGLEKQFHLWGRGGGGMGGTFIVRWPRSLMHKSCFCLT